MGQEVSQWMGQWMRQSLGQWVSGWVRGWVRGWATFNICINLAASPNHSVPHHHPPCVIPSLMLQGYYLTQHTTNCEPP